MCFYFTRIEEYDPPTTPTADNCLVIFMAVIFVLLHQKL